MEGYLVLTFLGTFIAHQVYSTYGAVGKTFTQEITLNVANHSSYDTQRINSFIKAARNSSHQGVQHQGLSIKRENDTRKDKSTPATDSLSRKKRTYKNPCMICGALQPVKFPPISVSVVKIPSRRGCGGGGCGRPSHPQPTCNRCGQQQPVYRPRPTCNTCGHPQGGGNSFSYSSASASASSSASSGSWGKR